MSIFGSIVNKIFGHAQASPAPATPPAGSSGTPASGGAAPSSFNNPTSSSAAPGSTGSAPSGQQPSAGTAPSSPAPGGGTQPGAGATNVDVTGILDGLAVKNAQKLDWRHSIVDLMKLLDLDSGLHARQELAKELHYTGSTDDSAAMNIWLHKQVMQKLAENGGKVPDDLK